MALEGAQCGACFAGFLELDAGMLVCDTCGAIAQASSDGATMRIFLGTVSCVFPRSVGLAHNVAAGAPRMVCRTSQKRPRSSRPGYRTPHFSGPRRGGGLQTAGCLQADWPNGLCNFPVELK